jgi:hypothetical protein
MITEEEVEREIRRVLVTRAAAVRIGTADRRSGTCPPLSSSNGGEGSRLRPSRPGRRPWGLGALPAVAALVTAIVLLGSWQGPNRQGSNPPTHVAAGSTVTGVKAPPSVRRAAGGVVLVREGRRHQQGGVATAATNRSEACGAGLPPKLVQRLRSTDCLESRIELDKGTHKMSGQPN